ncbi:argininosuccinate lyase [Vulgatibacter sp.]|uniref:argininosuccinate lyase n=1 Tax=Vulgatibacter sp. TaxID=1971226 RepID=UPI0035653E43
MATRQSKKAGAVSRAALAGKADPRLISFNASIDVDRHLWREDIAGSVAHAEMLGATGIIPQADADKLVKGLARVAREIERGEMQWSEELEDIHTHIERRLGEIVGPKVAGRLHTARSRNDQVALDERLFLVRAAHEADLAIRALQQALVAQAEVHAGTIMPGYTHLQRAQPITLGHHLLAYCEMFERDRGRFADARERAAVSPLGSGALAATSLPIDRQRVAGALGLSGITTNSLDGVSSRDALLEFLSAYAIAQVHLSRLAEEVCLWATEEFGFIDLDDGFCTGSSLMPQKKNPDVAELARGKAGRVIGDLVMLLTVVKGLPLAYNKDLQEDKEPVLDAHRTLLASFDATAGMIATARFREERMAAALERGEPCATDAAEWLVAQGVPFREAHEIVGRMARETRDAGRRLAELSEAELVAYHPAFGGAPAIFDPRRSLAARDLPGGPAPKRVAAEVRRWKRVLAK